MGKNGRTIRNVHDKVIFRLARNSGK